VKEPTPWAIHFKREAITQVVRPNAEIVPLKENGPAAGVLTSNGYQLAFTPTLFAHYQWIGAGDAPDMVSAAYTGVNPGIFNAQVRIMRYSGANVPVQLDGIRPNKVRYRRGEAGTIQVTLRNPAVAEQSVTVDGELTQELALTTPLPARAVPVPAGKTITVDLPFTAPRREYGCAARVRVKQGETLLAQEQEMFGVSDSL